MVGKPNLQAADAKTNVTTCSRCAGLAVEYQGCARYMEEDWYEKFGQRRATGFHGAVGGANRNLVSRMIPAPQAPYR